MKKDGIEFLKMDFIRSFLYRRYRFRACWSLVEWHSFLCKLSGTADIRFVSCFGMNLFLCAGGKRNEIKKENIIQNDRTGRYANYKLVKK